MSNIEAGYYIGKVLSGEFGENKAGDNVEAVIQMELLARDDGGPPLEVPLRVSVVLHFTEKAKQYSVEKLQAIGWQGGDLEFARCPNEVTVSIKYEEYQGVMRMKADIQAGAGRIKARTIAPEKKRAFAAQLAGLMGSAPKAGFDLD